MRRSTIGRTIGLVAALAVVAVLPGGIGGADQAAPPSGPWDRQPTSNEMALLALANMSRSEPSLDGGTESPRLPMLWNANLATAARYHSWDMAENSCFQHPSCNGGSWVKRVETWYGTGWTALGENIGGAGYPQHLHAGWMHSAGHRANILGGGFTEFGAGIWMGEDAFGTLPLGTENFGSRFLIPLSTYPVIPMAAVLPQDTTANTNRRMIVNYYNWQNIAPDAVEAVVNGQRVALTRISGNAGNGSYGLTRAFPASGCTPVYFEVKRAGQTFRFPETGAISTRLDGSDCTDTPPPPPTTTSTTSGPGTTTTTVAPPPPGDSPNITIDAPAPGISVNGTVEVRAHATDDGTVTRMELYVDGKRLVRRNTDTLVRKWEAGRYPSGQHAVEIRAWDDDGNLSTKSIVVTR